MDNFDNGFNGSSNQMPNVSGQSYQTGGVVGAQVGPPAKGGKHLIWEILSLVFMVLLLVSAGLAIWAYTSYLSTKEDVDGQIAAAVATAKKDQAEADEAKFAEREKSPLLIYVGSDDYGRVSFNYPRTWSQYVAKEGGSGKTYEAYFNPGYVVTVSNTNQYALRMVIEQKDYDLVVASFASLVKKGSLTSSLVTINGTTATRLDGTFSKDAKGSLVIIKIRDKTLTLRTDAETFKPDFDKLIQTIKFNQ